MVDGGEREEVGTVEDGGEVGDAVEEGDEVSEAGGEADDELGKDGFGDVFAWPGPSIREGLRYAFLLLALGFEEPYLGISSAR